MSESSFPFEGQPEGAPAASSPAAPTRDRRALALVAAVAVLAVAALGWFVVRPMLSSDDTTPASASRPVTTAGARTATKTGKGTTKAATKKVVKPVAVPKPFNDVVGRDPFKALVADTAPGATGGAAPSAAPVPAPVDTSAPTTSNDATGGSSSTTTSSGVRVALLDVFTKNGTSYAQTKVGTKVYTPAVGATFATTFELVSVQGKCATYLNGDDRFDLCEGQEVLK